MMMRGTRQGARRKQRITQRSDAAAFPLRTDRGRIREKKSVVCAIYFVKATAFESKKGKIAFVELAFGVKPRLNTPRGSSSSTIGSREVRQQGLCSIKRLSWDRLMQAKGINNP